MALVGLFQVSVKIILKKKDGKILILKNPKTSDDDQFWDLPGGRLNNDEFDAPYQDLVDRELREELGDRVRCKLAFDPASFGRHTFRPSPSGPLTQVFYLLLPARYLGGRIKVSKEHAGHKWVRIEQIQLQKYFTSGILESLQRYRYHRTEH